MNWKADILGTNFEQLTLPLRADPEGQVIATLVRSLTTPSNGTAILYIHGFNDYFFQKEMALKFNERGYNFYALDLRKYGRSYLPHQKFNDIRNLKSYYEEIDKALMIIRSTGNQNIILMGHSTGGLIVTLYARDNTQRRLFDGIILNSPFFEFNTSAILTALIPIASAIGKYFPTMKVGGVLSEEYGESLHKDYKGEWNYNLQWKPNTVPPISLGWLRAIREGHKQLKYRFQIYQPVLVLHSDATITDKKNDEQMHSMDAVLSVDHIAQIAQNIEGDVQIVAIKNGMHDLILSRQEVRVNVYTVMLNWMKQKI